MNSLPNLVESIKKAALEVTEATKPVVVMFGTVISISPLRINVEQKMTLESAQLILTRNVTEHTIEMTVNHVTENSLESLNLAHTHDFNGITDSGGTDSHTHDFNGTTDSGGEKDLTHSHSYAGRKTFIVHNGLVVGDEVLLIRMQGGQKFVVWDRIGI